MKQSKREIKFRALANGIEYFVETLPPNHKVQGYVRRKVTRHPGADKRGYVNEHRLVMEEYLGRFLEADEIIHHMNGVRDDNRIDNLQLLTDQKRHAAGHAASQKRDKILGKWLPDEKLEAKKFRLLNRNTGLMEIKDLSNLINTTFRKSQFEYRGEWTGLKEKNGVEIYEGDIVAIDWVYDKINFGDSVKRDNLDVEWGDRGWLPFNEPGSIDCAWCYDIDSAEVIGNIYENPELLVEDIHADQLGETLPAALERKKK